MPKRVVWVNEAGQRRCAGCLEYLPLDQFSKGGAQTPDGLYRYCKACQRAKDRAWYERNKAAKNAAARRWQAAHPEQVRAARRLSSRVRWWSQKLARQRAALERIEREA